MLDAGASEARKCPELPVSAMAEAVGGGVGGLVKEGPNLADGEVVVGEQTIDLDVTVELLSVSWSIGSPRPYAWGGRYTKVRMLPPIGLAKVAVTW